MLKKGKKEVYTEMDPELVIKQLNKWKCLDVEHKISFVGFRPNNKGQTLELQIDIFDSYSGPNRYSCVVKTIDGKQIPANPASTLDLAITNVHWYELDNYSYS
jgi:hypothetical protein